MCEQDNTKMPCNKQPINVGEIMWVEKKVFHNNHCGKHQETQAREKLHGHFNSDKSLMYPTGAKVNQIIQTAKSHSIYSYCTKYFGCKSCLTSKQRTDTEENVYLCSESK